MLEEQLDKARMQILILIALDTIAQVVLMICCVTETVAWLGLGALAVVLMALDKITGFIRSAQFRLKEARSKISPMKIEGRKDESGVQSMPTNLLNPFRKTT